MATYYLVGSSGNWQGGTIWATSSGGTAGAYTYRTDNVVFDVHSTGTVTVGTASTCNNFTMTSPGAGTITMGSTAVLTISGSMTCATGMTFAPNLTSQITFNGTTSGLTFNPASYTMGPVEFNGSGGVWNIPSSFTINSGGGYILVLTGSVNVASGITITLGSSGYMQATANGNITTLGTLTVSGGGSISYCFNGNITLGGNLTVSSGNITTGTGETFDMKGFNVSTVSFNQSSSTGVINLTGALTLSSTFSCTAGQLNLTAGGFGTGTISCTTCIITGITNNLVLTGGIITTATSGASLSLSTTTTSGSITLPAGKSYTIGSGSYISLGHTVILGGVPTISSTLLSIGSGFIPNLSGT